MTDQQQFHDTPAPGPTTDPVSEFSAVPAEETAAPAASVPSPADPAPASSEPAAVSPAEEAVPHGSRRRVAAIAVLAVLVICIAAVPFVLSRLGEPASEPAPESASAADAALTPEDAPTPEDTAAEGDSPAAEGEEAEGAPVPVLSEGLGYAFADDVLAAATPGLLTAVEAGADDQAVRTWIRSALTLMPVDYVSVWADRAGAGSLDAFAEVLRDPEVAALAAELPVTSFHLMAGEPCSAEETATIEARFQELGIEHHLQAACQVLARPSDVVESPDAADAGAPAPAPDAAAAPETVVPIPTPYFAVKLDDAWYFFPLSLEQAA